MKKIGILNQPISAVIAGLGHGDMLVIADAGLPIPPETVRIDLALVQGVPGFLQTVEAVLREMQVDKVILATETGDRSASPPIAEALKALLPGVPFEWVSHAQLKELSHAAVAVIRTGEFTPYANVILVSGVTF
jgi:D-ribose pyranase